MHAQSEYHKMVFRQTTVSVVGVREAGGELYRVWRSPRLHHHMFLQSPKCMKESVCAVTDYLAAILWSLATVGLISKRASTQASSCKKSLQLKHSHNDSQCVSPA